MRLRDENDLGRLKQKALLLEAENERLVKITVALQKENLSLKGESPEALQQKLKVLEEQLAQTRARLFGDSSEKRAVEKPKAEREKQVGHGPREQKQLPVVPKVHELDVADKVCPQCGGELTAWTGQFEESDEIDVVQRKFVVTRHQRQKYRCGCNACIETAPAPAKLIPGGRYSIDFAIEVATAKYLDHLPLERQVRMMAREGLVTDSQTLWDQINAEARLLAAAYEGVHTHQLQKPVVGIDESFWRMMGKSGRDEGENKRWQIWALASDDAIFYKVQDSRSAVAAAKVLTGYGGIVMADGYGVYEKLRLERLGDAGFQLVHCWDHARRKYVEAEPFFAAECGEAVELISRLYAIEDEGRGKPVEAITELRREKSKPALAELLAWALKTRARALPQSALGKAIHYMLGLWSGLTAYADDGRIPISNAFTERGLRGPVVGRKNHYGSRSERGTVVAALFYTLLESAKLCGLEPKAYLREATLAALAGRAIPLPHELATPAAG